MRKLLFLPMIIAFLSCSPEENEVIVIQEATGDTNGTIPDSNSQGHHVQVQPTFKLVGNDLTGHIFVQQSNVDFEDVSVSFYNENNELIATQYVVLPEIVNSNGEGIGTFSRASFQINSENYNGGQITILFFVKTTTTAGNWNRLLDVSSQYGDHVRVNVN